MKKIFVLLLCAMVLFTACQPALPMEGSKEESKEAVNSSSAPSEEASSEKPAEPSEEPGETSEEPKEPEPEEPKEPEETDLWIDAPTQAAQVKYRSDDRNYTAVMETVEEKQAFFEKYGVEGARERIYVTTDRQKGTGAVR